MFSLEKEGIVYISIFLLVLFCLFFMIVVTCALLVAHFFYKKRKEIFVKDKKKFTIGVSFSSLASAMHNEPPSTIALMLKYLEKESQEIFLDHLPVGVKKEVKAHLSKAKMTKKSRRD